jgi:hypothetical protein
MHNSSRPSSRCTRHGLGRLVAVAHKITGARVSVGDEKIHGKEELGFLELIHSGGSNYIDDGGRRPSSGTSTRRRRIGRLAVLHGAASVLRLKTIETVSWAGLRSWGAGPAWWATARWVLSPIFFCSVSFLFCFIFYFQISNLVLLNYFAGLN